MHPPLARQVPLGTLTLGSDYAIDSPATVQIGPGAILDIGATTQTVSGLTSAGAGTVHIGEGVLYINGSSTPAPVATPLPPLNLRKTGNRWPKKTASATRPTTASPKPIRCAAKAAIQPLSASPI